jgi:hypothetical protein
MSDEETTSSVLWPAYVLDHADGTRMVVIDVRDLGDWVIEDVQDDAESEEHRQRLMIVLRPVDG